MSNEILASLRRTRAAILTGLVAAAFTAAAAAQGNTYFQASLTGLQEVPPNSSTATGTGTFVLDSTAHVLHYRVDFGGLSSMETAAHIHGYAPPGVNAPILFPLPLGSPKIGTIVTTPEQEAQMRLDQTYVNIHSMVFPGGEIRGQIVTVATPAHVNFCFGDGTGTACPCGNNSTVGEEAGCVNSFVLASQLRARGIASLNVDTLVLEATGVGPYTSVLFFQGTIADNGGSGSAFGDGLRCAGGLITRLAITHAVNGAASYPESGDAPISVRGGVLTTGMQLYQAWYRNPAVYCMVEGFNTSNGVQVTWVQ